jgi:hypothetical protein
MSKRQSKTDDGMAAEYDFTSAVRGKFYRADATLVPPIHLEPDVLRYFQARAAARGTTVNTLVNEVLRRDIELFEVVR